jgi:hypothetical protein
MDCIRGMSVMNNPLFVLLILISFVFPDAIASPTPTSAPPPPPSSSSSSNFVTINDARLTGSAWHWVDTWAAMPQPTEPTNLPPPPFVSWDIVSSLAQIISYTNDFNRTTANRSSTTRPFDRHYTSPFPAQNCVCASTMRSASPTWLSTR